MQKKERRRFLLSNQIVYERDFCEKFCALCNYYGLRCDYFLGFIVHPNSILYAIYHSSIEVVAVLRPNCLDIPICLFPQPPP